MKRTYTKPLFYVEAYTFNESVATNPDCGMPIDEIKEPLEVIGGKNGTMLCPAPGDSGHRWYPDAKGNVPTITTKCGEKDNVITLFNDGNKTGGCEYDYDARKNVIAQTGDNFANSLFGNNANQDQHAPAWNGLIFRS